MDKFKIFRQNRAVWVALIEEGNLFEAENIFNVCMNNLCKLRIDKSLRIEKEKEITQMQKTFIERLFSSSDKYISKEEYTRALICYQLIVKYSPQSYNNIYFLENYIKCLAKTNQKDLAVDLIEHLETLDSGNIELLKYIAEMYDLMGDNQNSSKYLEKYITLKNPDEISAYEYNLLGCYYSKAYDESHRINDIQNSTKYFKYAYDKEPKTKVHAKNLTLVMSLQNKYTECKYYWDKVWETGHLNYDELFDYSAFCMKTGNLEDYYKYSYCRFLKTDYTPFPRMSKPLWDGQNDISDSILLVHFEQGFGDTILLWGYIPHLVKKAKKIIYLVQDALYPLLQKNNNFENLELLPAGANPLEFIQYDYYIPDMDIPKVLNINLDNISVGSGYIKADKEKSLYYKQKYFNNNDLKIGIAFQGNLKYNTNRNIPIEYFKIIDELENVKLYSLTKGFEDSYYNGFKNIVNIAKCFTNFDDTASIMDNLDVIISSDNGILNLAGAMGKKTFGLFNWHYMFRWYDLTGNDVGYYTSVKPFINEKMDDWSASMTNIANEIKNLI